MSRQPPIKEWSAGAHARKPSRPVSAERSSILIRNAHIIDPASGLDGPGDILIDQSGIVAVGRVPARSKAGQVIDADGLWLIPGIVDLCARFREPGQTRKATFASETHAAQASGITEILLPPDTQPVVDSPAMAIRVQRIADQTGGLDVRLIGALTRNLEGEALAELSALRAAGAVGVSNALAPVRDSLIARRALDYARGLGLTTHVFAQDATLAAGGCAHEGPVATRLGLASVPVAAEVAALRFWISLVEDTGARVHFCRLSTARGVELIESALARQLPVSADVAAHQLFLTDQDVDGFNAQCHVQPPLRTAGDRDALRDAVRSGVISAICSDHQPHEIDAKINPFAMTEPGVSGLETLLPLVLELIRENQVPRLDAVARLTLGPAGIAGTGSGRLAPGCPANLALIDPDCEWTLDPARLRSSGHNTPFAGKRLHGKVLRTFHHGREVFNAVDP
ncbi:MAG: dihydroorotase [Nevskiales bacterium]|nr:dihydroorotase [Nevskiales bacterium]